MSPMCQWLCSGWYSYAETSSSRTTFPLALRISWMAFVTVGWKSGRSAQGPSPVFAIPFEKRRMSRCCWFMILERRACASCPKPNGHDVGKGACHAPESGVPFDSSSNSLMLTVQDIAAMPGLRLTVAAGAEGLGNQVTWLHVSELSDPTQFLQGGEFLLTTGLGVGEMEATQ